MSKTNEEEHEETTVASPQPSDGQQKPPLTGQERIEEEHEETTVASPQPSDGQQKPPLTGQERIERWFEVITAILLGVVAVVTAWSGYQATRWAGEESTLYAKASALRVEATRDSALAGQLRLYDLDLVNNWMNAYVQGNTKLANIFEKRFRSEFWPTFLAWLALDPFNNPKAPPGPLFMPQYKISQEQEANQLEKQAANTFTEGLAAKEQGDAYVLNTVLLAVVLFLTAIAENFKWNTIRAVILAVAVALLLFGIYHLIIFPIL